MRTDNGLTKNTPNILIVDDVPMNLLIICEILKNSNYNIFTASDGYLALQVSEMEKPDLILLDIMMPDIDGFEVCRRLKANESLCNIPVIFISALSDSKNIVKGFECGGVDYITKPFQQEEVKARVETHLKLYYQSKELKELNDSLRLSEEQLQKFSLQLQSIREEERVLLGTEIHDKIGQMLVALKIDMGIWRKNVLYKLENAISPDILTNFNELVNIVDNTISTAREITNDLKYDDLEILGFIEAAKSYCSKFQIAHNVNCSFESTITKIIIDEQHKITLYKVLQELLLSINKYANASSIKVTIQINNQNLVIEIEDDGVSFYEEKMKRKDDYAFLSIKERVILLKGTMVFDTKMDKRNLVRIEIPQVYE